MASKGFDTDLIIRRSHRGFENDPIERSCASTNLLVNHCLEGDYDYLWIVEGDVVVPSDALEKLLALDADLALGCYPYHHDRNLIIGGYFSERENRSPERLHMMRHELEGHILEGPPFVFAGAGCMLIKRRVFEAGLRFRHRGLVFGFDLDFCYEVQKAGFEAKLHGGVICGHLPEWPLGEDVKKNDF